MLLGTISKAPKAPLPSRAAGRLRTPVLATVARMPSMVLIGATTATQELAPSPSLSHTIRLVSLESMLDPTRVSSV